MKESELRKHAICSLCHRKIMADDLPLFYVVTIERFGIEMNAVNRQQGLTMFLGGHAGLAGIMGPDEDMATPLMEKKTLTICENCSTRTTVVAALAELEGVK